MPETLQVGLGGLGQHDPKPKGKRHLDPDLEAQLPSLWWWALAPVGAFYWASVDMRLHAEQQTRDIGKKIERQGGRVLHGTALAAIAAGWWFWSRRR